MSYMLAVFCCQSFPSFLFRLLWFVYYALTCSIADAGELVKGVGVVYRGGNWLVGG